jgi:hypothetical protein
MRISNRSRLHGKASRDHVRLDFGRTNEGVQNIALWRRSGELSTRVIRPPALITRCGISGRLPLAAWLPLASRNATSQPSLCPSLRSSVCAPSTQNTPARHQASIQCHRQHWQKLVVFDTVACFKTQYASFISANHIVQSRHHVWHVEAPHRCCTDAVGACASAPGMLEDLLSPWNGAHGDTCNGMDVP